MTWALHWESSCMPCRAKSNSFLYSASVFWASWRPDPVTTYMDIHKHSLTQTVVVPNRIQSTFTHACSKKSTRADGVYALLSKSFPQLGVLFSSSQWIQTFFIFNIPIVKKPCPVALTSIVIKSFEKYILSALDPYQFAYRQGHRWCHYQHHPCRCQALRRPWEQGRHR